NGGKNSLNRLIRCVCGKKIGPDPRNFNQRVSLGRNDLLIRTFHRYYRAEVYLKEGGQNYDVMGWNQEQLINDILDQYEKHLHFLHLVR
ncbi:hypothetical protein, partial [Klebsiella pneumoniae]|uniref:hypothetical protein n=1 Tax=Klebsiella pneumoniae TaxID=573 RepID=UPI0022467A4E